MSLRRVEIGAATHGTARGSGLRSALQADGRNDGATILITGASSGLGAALAEHYAAAGVTLLLLGRNAARLQHVQAACEARGAKVSIHTVDVNDAAAMQRLIVDLDTHQPIDLAIANAGISAGTGLHSETPEQADAIFATNIHGVTHTLHPLIPRMQARRCGQMAIISSIAGMLPVASAPAYSASKAWARAYALALRGMLAPDGVCVSAVCPGYIATPMTAHNPFFMPWIMSASRAARTIAVGLKANRAQIAFPLPMLLLACSAGLLPECVRSAVFRWCPKKPAFPESVGDEKALAHEAHRR